MKIQISHVDLSALTEWRDQYLAVSELCHEYSLPDTQIIEIGPALFQITKVVA